MAWILNSGIGLIVSRKAALDLKKRALSEKIMNYFF